MDKKKSTEQELKLPDLQDDFLTREAEIAASLGDTSGVTARPIQMWRQHSQDYSPLN
ncbi:MAG: hypothetical protein K2X29_03835 [Candidatus Obscuribacterales bacterium]|nr:hypothetical protein [Candidatus Obscuribacterales bacterium]